MKIKSNSLHEAMELVAEVQQLSDDDLYDLHGIEIFNDNSVHDVIENVQYATVLDWAKIQIDTVNETSFQKRKSSRHGDDDY